MAYRALYREYRPRAFSEVIGQEHITTVLKNQVAADHIAHAYLFCGTRGTGKTTTARILARAVNCLDPVDGEPCGRCAACIAAMDESNGDIMELDAASNNGVDDARSIIEQAQYAPLSMRRRVFIIDEAHMLTTPAFNALLKTLEEPPAHVLFILATTEPQKLPATIISRCQRFDFHRLTCSDIVKTLETVLKKAGAEVDEEGLMLIARAADGGMRDALSLTDQCLSFIGDRVTKADVYDVLGSMDEGFLFELADALIASDAKKALTMLDEAVRGGRDLTVFANDLAAHVRALLLTKTCGDCADMLDCTKDAMARYAEQAARAGKSQLLLALELLLNAQSEMRFLPSPRTLLESVLVHVCRPEDTVSLDALTARLDRLEAGGSAVHAAASVEYAQSAPMQIKQEPIPQKPERPVPTDAALPAAQPPDDLVPPPEDAENGAPAPGFVRAEKNPLLATGPGPAVPPVGADAAGLWSAFLSELNRQNVLLHALAKYGVPLSLADSVLTVGFDGAHSVQRSSLTAPVNQTKLQTIIASIAPETRLSLVESRGGKAAAEEDVARAKALFGDKLKISDS